MLLFINLSASKQQVIYMQYDSSSAPTENVNAAQGTPGINYAYNVRLNLSGKKLTWLARQNMTDPTMCFYIQCKTGGIKWRDLDWCNIGNLDYKQRKLRLKSFYRSEYEYGVTMCPCNKNNTAICPPASPATLHTPWWEVLFYVMGSVVTLYLVLSAVILTCQHYRKKRDNIDDASMNEAVQLTRYTIEHAHTNDVNIDVERDLPPPSYDHVTIATTPAPSVSDFLPDEEDLPPDYNQATQSP